MQEDEITRKAHADGTSFMQETYKVQYFAVMAMQGIIAHFGLKHNGNNHESLAEQSFDIAEAMLKESVKRRK